MTPTHATLAAVAALAAAGARRRGSPALERVFYHATPQDDAIEILANGFLAGWGDIGFGVYFYGTLSSVKRYVQKGGWGGELVGEDPVILAVQDPRIRKIEDFELDSSWDKSKYGDMYILEGDEDGEETPIFVKRIEVLS